VIRVVTARHASYTGSPARLTGYYDLTARMPDGTFIPFRVDLLNAGTDPRSGWKIQAIKYDQESACECPLAIMTPLTRP